MKVQKKIWKKRKYMNNKKINTEERENRRKYKDYGRRNTQMYIFKDGKEKF